MSIPEHSSWGVCLPQLWGSRARSLLGGRAAPRVVQGAALGLWLQCRERRRRWTKSFSLYGRNQAWGLPPLCFPWHKLDHRRVLLSPAKHRDFICALSDTREKRNSLSAPNPPAPSWVEDHQEDHQEQEILLAITRFWDFVQTGQQSSKDEEERTYSTLARQKGIIYVLTAWQRTKNLLSCPSHFYTTAHGESCVFSIIISSVPKTHVQREEFSWSFGRGSPMFFLSWQKRIQRFLRMHDKLCHLLSLVGSAGPQFGREREEGIAL